MLLRTQGEEARGAIQRQAGRSGPLLRRRPFDRLDRDVDRRRSAPRGAAFRRRRASRNGARPSRDHGARSAASARLSRSPKDRERRRTLRLRIRLRIRIRIRRRVCRLPVLGRRVPLLGCGVRVVGAGLVRRLVGMAGLRLRGLRTLVRGVVRPLRRHVRRVGRGAAASHGACDRRDGGIAVEGRCRSGRRNGRFRQRLQRALGRTQRVPGPAHGRVPAEGVSHARRGARGESGCHLHDQRCAGSR